MVFIEVADVLTVGDALGVINLAGFWDERQVLTVSTHIPRSQLLALYVSVRIHAEVREYVKERAR